MSPITINQVQPEFGVNYRAGDIGWKTDKSDLAAAIAYGERWEHKDGYPIVTHAFVVASATTVIEAGPDGVKENPFTYLSDPGCSVYIRSVKINNAQRVADAARKYIGTPYNFGLLAMDAANDTILGHLLSPRIHNWLCKLCDGHGFICSELAAATLNDLPELRGLGILGTPLDTIDPQALIQSDDLFAPFIDAFVPQTPARTQTGAESLSSSVEAAPSAPSAPAANETAAGDLAAKNTKAASDLRAPRASAVSRPNF